MDQGAPRPGFSLDALIAEAKRRARQRRFLVLLAVLVVAAVAAAVTFGSPGGGSGQGSPVRAGDTPSDGTQIAQVGPFALTVPRGLYAKATCTGVAPCTASKTTMLEVSDHPLGHSIPEGLNRVYLELSYVGHTIIRGARLPLDLQKLQVSSGRKTSSGDAFVSAGPDGYGGQLDYSVHVSWGKRTSAVERAAILRALSSIRHSS
jgi:hypothetical protein